MSKSKFADYAKADNAYINNVYYNISHEMTVKNITVREISKKTGNAESTVRLRFNNPGTFKQQEIVDIAKVFKISPFKLVSQQLKYEEVNA